MGYLHVSPVVLCEDVWKSPYNSVVHVRIPTLSCSCSLEMLDKMDVPMIVEGYPLVVAMNALLYAIKSVSLVINDKITSRATTPPPTSPGTYDFY